MTNEEKRMSDALVKIEELRELITQKELNYDIYEGYYDRISIEEFLDALQSFYEDYEGAPSSTSRPILHGAYA